MKYDDMYNSMEYDDMYNSMKYDDMYNLYFKEIILIFFELS